MSVFTYEARTTDGRTVEGQIKASDRSAAQTELKKKSLNIVTLVEKKNTGGKGLFGPPRPKVKTRDMCVLTRQLSTMISAGIPLLEAMEILQEQTQDPGFKNVLSTVVDRIRSGSDFSTALSEHPKCFTKIYINMVKAGEASGQLDTILNRLAEYMESIEELKHEIKAAMTYPIVSLCLILVIATGLVVFIIPKFAEIYKSMPKLGALPGLTQLLLDISDLVREKWYFVILIFGAIGTGTVMYVRTPRGQWQWHWLSLHIPVFGSLFQKVAISRFARTFATLIQSGVPMLGALDIVAGTAGNRIVEDAVLKSKEAVSRGETLGEPLASSRVFPPMVTRMIAIGEKTGALEKLLVKISEFYDQEVKATVKSLTALIEPMLIAVMGFVVGGIVVAMFLPILKIPQMLNK